MTFNPTIYNRRHAPGQMWSRSISNKTERISSIHNTLSSLSPMSSASLLTGIKMFDVLYDTGVIVVPENIFLFKINTDYNTGDIFTTADEAHVISLDKSTYVNTWFFPESQSLTVCKLVSCTQGNGAQIRPVLYNLNIDNFDLTFLYNLTSTDTQYYYEFTNIDSTTLTYDHNKQVYNVSFTAYAKCNSGMYLCSLNIEKKNNEYVITSSKVIEPVGAYICSNLEVNLLSYNDIICTNTQVGFVAHTTPYCTDLSCAPIDRYEWYIDNSLVATVNTDALEYVYTTTFDTVTSVDISVKVYDTLNNTSSANLFITTTKCTQHIIYPDVTTVYEGQSVDFIVETEYVPNNTVLYWCLYLGSAEAADFEGPVYGEVIINYGYGRFTVNIARDELLDDNETFGAYLLSEQHTSLTTPPNEDIILASTIGNEVTIIDVGFNDLQIQMSADRYDTCANTNVTFTAVASNFCTEDLICTPITKYEWYVDGTLIQTNETSITSSTLIRSFSDYRTYNIQVTVFDEENRTASVSRTITNIDCRSYAISPDQNEVNEGDTVRFTVETENVPNGTTLYWSMYFTGGTTEPDIETTPLYGSVTINNNIAYIFIDVASDVITPELGERFGLYLLSSPHTTGGTPSPSITLASTLGNEVLIINVDPTVSEDIVIDRTFRTNITETSIKNIQSVDLTENFGGDSSLANVNRVTNVVYLPWFDTNYISKIKIKDLSQNSTSTNTIEKLGVYNISKTTAAPSRTIVLPEHNYSSLIACRKSNEIIYLDNNENGDLIPTINTSPLTDTAASAFQYGTDKAHRFTMFCNFTNSTLTILSSSLSANSDTYRTSSNNYSYGCRGMCRLSNKDVVFNIQTTGRWYIIPGTIIEDAINNKTEYYNYSIDNFGWPSNTQLGSSYGCVANQNDVIFSIDNTENRTRNFDIIKNKKILKITGLGTSNYYYGISIHENRYILMARLEANNLIIIDSLCPTIAEATSEFFTGTDSTSSISFDTFAQAVKGIVNENGEITKNGSVIPGILYPPAQPGTTYEYSPIKLLTVTNASRLRLSTVYNNKIFSSGWSSNRISRVDSHTLKNNRDSDSLMFGPSTCDKVNVTVTANNTGVTTQSAGLATVTDDFGNVGMVVLLQHTAGIDIFTEGLDTGDITTYRHSLAAATYNYTNFTGYESSDVKTPQGTLSFSIQPDITSRPDPTTTWTNLAVDIKRDPPTPTSMPASAEVVINASGLTYQQSVNLNGVSEGTISFASIMTTNTIIDDTLGVTIRLFRDPSLAIGDETIYIDQIRASYDYV